MRSTSLALALRRMTGTWLSRRMRRRTLQAVHFGHHDVQDDEIGLGLMEQGQRGLAVGRVDDAVAFPLQVRLEDAAQVGLVVGKKDFWRWRGAFHGEDFILANPGGSGVKAGYGQNLRDKPILARFVSSNALQQAGREERLDDVMRSRPCNSQGFLNFLYAEGPCAQQENHLLLPRRERQPQTQRFDIDRLNALPGPLQRLIDGLGDVFHPPGQIVGVSLGSVKGSIIALAIFQQHLINGEDMIGVELPPIKLPCGQGPTHSAVAVSEGMDELELIMEHGGAYDGRPCPPGSVNPVQKLAHQRGNLAGLGREVLADAHLIGTEKSRGAAVQSAFLSDNGMEAQNVSHMDGSGSRILLNEPQRGEIIEHFLDGAGLGMEEFSSLREDFDLGESQRIALDGR